VLSVAEAIGRQLDLPIKGIPAERFGFPDSISGMDQPASSVPARQKFGWQPTIRACAKISTPGTIRPDACRWP
jgi:hypothetical protein